MSLNGPPLHAELIAPRIGAHVLMAFRESGWRREKASARKSTSRAAGIV